jgi:hypothetical protein
VGNNSEFKQKTLHGVFARQMRSQRISQVESVVEELSAKQSVVAVGPSVREDVVVRLALDVAQLRRIQAARVGLTCRAAEAQQQCENSDRGCCLWQVRWDAISPWAFRLWCRLLSCIFWLRKPSLLSMTRSTSGVCTDSECELPYCKLKAATPSAAAGRRRSEPTVTATPLSSTAAKPLFASPATMRRRCSV